LFKSSRLAFSSAFIFIHISPADHIELEELVRDWTATSNHLSFKYARSLVRSASTSKEVLFLVL
jgi:hypothetical protein